eukprot:COSAG06_NODE_495_length_15047_cov_11.349478_3_plen_584_part_00
MNQSDVRISAENGLDFMAGQTIGVYIPPSIKYFSGKDCYLQCDVLIQNDESGTIGRTRLMLDAGCGGNALIQTCRVYAGNRATLLEENTQYNTYCAFKYDFSRTDTDQNKRALTEGCGSWMPQTRGTRGTTKSIANNYINNPYMRTANHNDDPNANLKATNKWSNATDFITAKLTLPIHMGVFANNSKVFPNLLTDGCYVEFTLADTRNVFRQLDSVVLNRRLRLNPRLAKVDENDGGTLKTTWANGAKTSKLYLGASNSNSSVQNVPFVVGEKIGLAKGDKDMTEANLDAVFEIDEINSTGQGVQLIGKAQVTNSGGGLNLSTDEYYLFSQSLASLASTNTYAPTFKLSNVEIIVHQIDMGQQYEKAMLSKVREQGGVIEFDIPSVQCHTHSTLSTDVQSTIPLNIEYARAKSIVCVPTDANIYPCQHQTCGKGTYTITKDTSNDYLEDIEIRSNRTGLAGCANTLTAYSFFLNGKQVPSREINCTKTTNKDGGIDANYMLELEKGLVAAGINVNSFTEYQRNFLVTRMLAMGENAVFDGRGRTARLNCRYDTAPTTNMLWKNFVFHIRKLVIKGDNIHVEV